MPPAANPSQLPVKSRRLLVITSVLVLTVIVIVFVIPLNHSATAALNQSYFDSTPDEAGRPEWETPRGEKQKSSTDSIGDDYPATPAPKRLQRWLERIKRPFKSNAEGQDAHSKKREGRRQIPHADPITEAPPAGQQNEDGNNDNDQQQQQSQDVGSVDFRNRGMLEDYEPTFIKNVAAKLEIPDGAPRYVRNVYDLWSRSFEDRFLKKHIVVPAMVVPTFHDSEHLENLLKKFDTPVRHIVFINNANDDPGIRRIMLALRPLQVAGAISVYWFPQNAGFSKSVNVGLRRNRKALTQSDNNWDMSLNPLWYFIVNCDSLFEPGSAAHFSKRAQENLRVSYEELNPKDAPKKQKVGLFYTTRIDHFCFGISEEAVQRAGDMDECFYPAYFEDIDWRWRVHLAGFDECITQAQVGHHRSVNLKKASPNSPFMQMLHRTARGWEYGRMKWGNVQVGTLRSKVPPTGRTTPFGIKNAPLSLYKIDPVHRRCVITGRGTYFARSTSCWYNGTVLLDALPEGTKLPEFLVRPVPSMSEYYMQEDKSRMRRALRLI